jgi:hypothetical protein
LAAAGHEDLRAFDSEALGRGEADAGGATGNDSDFSFEFACRDLSPCWRGKSVAAAEIAK